MPRNFSEGFTKNVADGESKQKLKVFTTVHAYGFTKTVVAVGKPKLKVFTTGKTFGFTKTAVDAEKPKLTVVTTPKPFGFTKTVVADEAEIEMASPNIEIDNYDFEEKK